MDLLILAASVGALAGLAHRARGFARASGQSPAAMETFRRELKEGRPLASWMMVVTILLCALFATLFSAAIVDGFFPPAMWFVVAGPVAVAFTFAGMLLRRAVARRVPGSGRA